ncbi:MAG: EamA family transporter [Phycisphaerae bacterium]|nr:DMT family transporter [Phycisphaerae bacterium]NIP55559.1 DMT family transporter [Phycisphaerae bacterium]NIS54790.1 DMT family transporter [Phycisphaerae bacterium]NIU11889.1 DMT family transporter [Phycisphaerae bacterium]NIU59724.1 EamA family transporter [Phycisphaerae bacterium]
MKKQPMVTLNTKKFDITATFACLGTLSFWAFGPIFIKYLAGYIDSWTQNLLRYSAACLFWLPFLLYAIRKNRFEPRIWRKALLPAVPNIVMQSLWAGGFYFIGPAFMVLLKQSSIIWIAALSFILFADERALVNSKRFWSGLLLSVIGVVGVMYYKDDFAATQTLIGIIIALAMAFAWALYTISAKIAFKDIDSHHSFAVMSIYTTAGLFVLALLFGRVQESVTMGAWQWTCIVISGITSISLAHVLYYVAIKRIGATLPALVILSQPFIVLAISNVVFGESLNAIQLLFGVILLLGSALAIWAQQDLRRNGPDKT